LAETRFIAMFHSLAQLTIAIRFISVAESESKVL